MKHRASLLAVSIWILAALTLLASVATAAWEHQGNPVTTASGNQRYPEIISDGAGGAIITWEDTPNSADILAQRLDAAGNALWTLNGEVICGATGHQAVPQIASDGAGGAIITWEDHRSEVDIYAQRVDAAGNIQWTINGVAICTVAGDQLAPQIVSDEAGGAIIVWEDYRSGIDIYAQRIDASGNVLWTVDGEEICPTGYEHLDPVLVSDGMGGAVITWEDWRSGVNIYAQHLDRDGNAGWVADGRAICTADGDQEYPDIASDGGSGAIIVWDDSRSVSPGIYARRVNSRGTVLWTSNGVAICTASGGQSDPKIAYDGDGGAVITWEDTRSGTKVYAQRVGPLGSVAWAADGVPICSSTGNQYNPEIVSDGAGGAIVVWGDYRAANYDVCAQRIDALGNLLWDAGGVSLCTQGDDQTQAKVTSDGAGGAIATWFDPRFGLDIFAQSVDRNGYWGYPAPEIQVLRDVPEDEGGFVTLGWDASRLDLWPDLMITHYTIWRAVDRSTLANGVSGDMILGSFGDAGRAMDRGPVLVDALLGSGYYWQLVATTDAYHFGTYSEIVPTAYDSTSTSDAMSWFQVVAHAGDSLYWISPPDSGYSVDNLAPGMPLGLSGDYDGSQLLMTWHPNTEDDLSHYAVYKGSSEDFVPDASNRVAEVTDTLLVEETFDPGMVTYYKVSAWDVHENESSFSELTGEQITGVSGGSHVMMLAQNEPNPFGSETMIRFSLAEPGPVQIRVFDVHGRAVRTLVDEFLAPDSYSVAWDGTSDRGTLVAPGVYTYKMEANGFSRTMKMVRLR